MRLPLVAILIPAYACAALPPLRGTNEDGLALTGRLAFMPFPAGA